MSLAVSLAFSVTFEGVSEALGVAFEAPSFGGFDLGVVVVDFLPAPLEYELSFSVEEDSGFLPCLVGVDGCSVLPAAGEGAILLKLFVVLGVPFLDDGGEGEFLLGVGGNE